MRFTKRQREILKQIGSGAVYDMSSFAARFSLTERQRYDRAKVKSAFEADPERQTYFCPKALLHGTPELWGEKEYLRAVEERRIAPGAYAELSPKLVFGETCRKEQILGHGISFDLYQGVSSLKDFDAMVEFLALWQYLQEEGLALTVPQPLECAAVELFFDWTEAGPPPDPVIGGDKETPELHFSDRRYLQPRALRLREDWLAVCREYLERRLYPTPMLKLFLQNGFRTREELTQDRALLAAWCAVGVTAFSVLLPLLPGLLKAAERVLAGILG